MRTARMRVFTSCTDRNPTPSLASSGLCPKSDGTSTGGMVPISAPIAGAPESRPALDSTSGFESTDCPLQAAPHNTKTEHTDWLLSPHTAHLPKAASVHANGLEVTAATKGSARAHIPSF